MKTKAQMYGEIGFRYVYLEYNSNIGEYEIIQAFKSHYKRDKFIDSLPLSLQCSNKYLVLTINQAVKKGY